MAQELFLLYEAAVGFPSRAVIENAPENAPGYGVLISAYYVVVRSERSRSDTVVNFFS